MVNEWNARTEILAATHRWPVVMLFILIGSLVGVAIAYLLPSPYRAESTLHVAYNADVHLRNPDDYKNWQMEQLNLLIVSDEVLQETADSLETLDSEWSKLTPEDLRTNLHVYWRNAGEWNLVAEASSPEQAQQLLNTWQRVLLEQIQAATDHAYAVLDLSTQVDTTYLERMDTNQRIAELNQIEEAIQTWMSANQGDQADDALETSERWFLLSSVSSAAGLNPEGATLLMEAPSPDAEASAYIPWLEKTLVFIDQQLATLETLSRQLSAEYDQFYAQWSAENESTRGLTAYLVVTPVEGGNQPVQAVRSVALMAFVGGGLGLLVWALVWLAKPVSRARSHIS